jgi:ubiquinone/menaquinone biosynthesis C-methylase UbiE
MTGSPVTDSPLADSGLISNASGNKDKPAWAGNDFLSRVVNLLIKTPPLYRVMKSQARRVLIKTAEKNGIQWRENYQALKNQVEAKGTQQVLAEASTPDVAYPDYYQVPFHAYEAGNLCWPAAFEAESATYAMALRVWPNEKLSWQAAQARLRSSFHEVLAAHGPKAVTDILDIGCSVGISTRSLHDYYSHLQGHPVRTVGLDLSPYMLSVAKLQDQSAKISQWVHAKAEETDFADCSFDLVTLQFVIHELPRHITQAIFREAHRLLRPNGCIAIVDNNPQSPVIQGLPPVLFTLMKSTEPWSDDYYTFNVEAALKESGFESVTTVASDPRHRTIVGRKY